MKKAISAMAVYAFLAFIFLLGSYWAKEDILPKHDEAEFLHIVFSLDQNVFPIKDFIENHPALPHIALNKIKNLLHIENVKPAYRLFKAFLIFHFLGCCVFLWLLLKKAKRHLTFYAPPASLLLFAFLCTSVFEDTGEGQDALWQLRPDWFCYFYAIAAAYFHFEALQLVFNEGRSWFEKRVIGRSVLGAVLAGVSGAILAKSVYIFLPYVLFLVMLFFNKPETYLDRLIQQIKGAIATQFLFVLITVLCLVGLAYLEISITHNSMQTYWAANYLLNAKKHMVFVNMDLSPTNVFRSLLGTGLVSSLMFAIWLFYQLRKSILRSQEFEQNLLLFLIVVLFCNLFLPAFSNGQGWSQYLIPAVLASTLLLALLINQFLSCFFFPWHAKFLQAYARRPIDMQRLTKFGRPVLLAFFFVLINHQMYDGYVRWHDTYEFNWLNPDKPQDRDNFLSDQILPNNFKYLTFNPANKPIRAQAWGYYYMLGPDTGMWKDNYELGLSPEPKTHWKKLFQEDPPDAILVSSLRHLRHRAAFISAAQDVDIDWMFNEITKNYQCLIKRSFRLFVNNKHLERFKTQEWASCSKEGP